MKKINYFEDDNIRFSMKQKLMILFLIVGIVPLMTLGYFAYTSQKQVIRDQIIDSSKRISVVLAQELNEKIITAHKMLKSTSKLPSLQTGNFGEEEKTILRTTLNNFTIFKNLYFVDSRGSRGIAAVNKGGSKVVKQLSEIDDIDPNVLKYWYFGSVRGSNVNNGFYSDVYFDKETGFPMQVMGVYVRNNLLKPVGILIAEISLTEVWEAVKRVNFGKTGFAFVIDEKTGFLIAHSNEEKFDSKTKYIDNDKINELKSLGDGGRVFINSITPKFASYVSTELFKDDLVRTGGFFSPTWGVVIEQTEREAFQPARELMKKFMYVVTVFMLFSIALGVAFSHGITRPLKMLHKVALSIAGGDLSQELQIDSGDEIGELAKSFDKMRKNLKKKMSDLKILYEISQTISAVLDYKELLSEIMDISINVLEAEKGSIMLFDDETEMLKIEASYGLPEDIIRDTLINPNRGIVGWVIRTGKPLLIYDTMKEAGFEKMKGRKAESGTLMSAPLKVKDKLIGVVNISKSIPNTYNDSDRDLFEAIALQAAIAIDKAILYRLAITDGLTKLYIHRYFQQRFDEELQRAKRYSKPLSFLMMDIDHFKIFNDTYGHQVGDRVLKIVARLVEKSVRDVDIVARYGGEEFSVILPELDTQEAEVPAERIRKNIETYDFYVEDKIVPITVSLGISTYPIHAEEKADIIEAADNALYYSKETGRNKYSAYTPEIGEKLKELKNNK